MKVCIIGTGYVGLVTGACLAENGNDVWCVDVDHSKIEGLMEGKVSIYEPGLEDMVKRNLSEGRLRFTTDLEEALRPSLFVFIAVGTPPREDGCADLTHVYEVASRVGGLMETAKIIVAKSTIPVGTTAEIRRIIGEKLAERGLRDLDFDVAFCPEFLKEGAAVEDCLRPDRIIIGTEREDTDKLLRELFAPFVMREDRFYTMSIPSAEMTKYASNAMLATRISFMNELSRLCEISGADIESIRQGIGSDTRIGMPFLYAGLGYGGSCFPKDVKALIQTSKEFGLESKVLKAVEEINHEQRFRFADNVKKHFGGDVKGKTFAMWGLSFKPQTDDMREAPAIDIISVLRDAGARFRAHDPVAMEVAKSIIGDKSVTYVSNYYDALEGADALLLLTEWNQFRRPDYERMKSLLKQPIIFDGRNQYDPAKMKEIGFTYYCIGRP